MLTPTLLRMAENSRKSASPNPAFGSVWKLGLTSITPCGSIMFQPLLTVSNTSRWTWRKLSSKEAISKTFPSLRSIA